ncbi:unnamed protein product [Lupinus luteus]|uniref:Uncharacterized protein n=1 Tax=Lupinus luteus TaxID=3873 RepID=A0AAV1WUM3_LUPLU
MEARAILEDGIDVDDCVELVVVEDTIEVWDPTSDSEDEVVALAGAGVGAAVMANEDGTEGDQNDTLMQF